jgi:hypothetical protein
MTPELLACPYCNAQTPRPETGGRVICPRCGESFTWRGNPPVEGTDSSPPSLFLSAVSISELETGRTAKVRQLVISSVILAATSLTLKLAFPESNTTQRAFPFMVLLSAIGLVASMWLWFLLKPRRNFTIALFILGNMACVASIVLPFAVATRESRRGNDPKGVPKELAVPVNEVREIPPSSLAGLGYLPEDCNLAAGIHVAELTTLPAGAKLLAWQGEGETRPWLLQMVLGPVERWTGLLPEAVDHVVVGTHLDATLPNLIIVIRTRQPYNPQALAKAQAPAVAVRHLDRDLYQFSTKPVGAGMLYAADPKTLILILRVDAVTERDKQLLSAVQRTGTAGPPELLRTILRERLSSATPIWWAATEIERPEIAMALLPIGRKDSELAKLLRNAKSVVGGLRLQKDAEVMGAVECADAQAARRLATVLEQQTVDRLGSPKAFGPAPESQESWVSFQLRGSPEAVAAALHGVQLTGRLPGKQ